MEHKTILFHILLCKLNGSHYPFSRSFRNPLISQMQGLNLAQQLLLKKQLSICHGIMCGHQQILTTSLLVTSDIFRPILHKFCWTRQVEDPQTTHFPPLERFYLALLFDLAFGSPLALGSAFALAALAFAARALTRLPGGG